MRRRLLILPCLSILLLGACHSNEYKVAELEIEIESTIEEQPTIILIRLHENGSLTLNDLPLSLYRMTSSGLSDHNGDGTALWYFREDGVLVARESGHTAEIVHRDRLIGNRITQLAQDGFPSPLGSGLLSIVGPFDRPDFVLEPDGTVTGARSKIVIRPMSKDMRKTAMLLLLLVDNFVLADGRYKLRSGRPRP